MKYLQCIDCGKPKETKGEMYDRPRCRRCSHIIHNDSRTAFYQAWHQLKSMHKLNISYSDISAAFKDYYKYGMEFHPAAGKIYLLSSGDTARLMHRTGRDLPQGVYFNKKRYKYYWQLNIDYKAKTGYGWNTAEEAAASRDAYIVSNGITARLTDGSQHIVTDYPIISYEDIR